jgi:hypothetical protein
MVEVAPYQMAVLVTYDEQIDRADQQREVHHQRFRRQRVARCVPRVAVDCVGRDQVEEPSRDPRIRIDCGGYIRGLEAWSEPYGAAR